MVLAWQEAVPDIVAQGNARTPLGRPAEPVEIAEAAAWRSATARPT
ncbi:hypothetical protein CLV43_102534 [Umezawaea tangerina]|uniref:Uncharacterized protein n=1 Tax=Umezawaea tangerina TaxID=84725 RepID=A0A2T0TH65_9PSEU|nr:hypothetical protein [Umezawaea tangerina]PRY44969.1 hypothetical protein CLV43_102534 [Umezawaea tangerina]